MTEPTMDRGERKGSHGGTALVDASPMNLGSMTMDPLGGIGSRSRTLSHVSVS